MKELQSKYNFRSPRLDVSKQIKRNSSGQIQKHIRINKITWEIEVIKNEEASSPERQVGRFLGESSKRNCNIKVQGACPVQGEAGRCELPRPGRQGVWKDLLDKRSSRTEEDVIISIINDLLDKI